MELSSDKLKDACLITASYLFMYSVTMVIQGLSRATMESRAKAAKKHFDRFTDPRMRPLDRVVGNTLEWLPVFLGLFWLATLMGAETTTLGWAYVATRVAYAVIAYTGLGISKTAGAQPPILLATVPAYVVLWKLGAEVFSRALH
ncbi:MAG: hypothetical protein J3K34DRAFT_426099 [Monoraphidium minutum]|nr:MAG: hypothetical protein J3K34DRAFT_426099 [Monoraphidium minutum]